MAADWQKIKTEYITTNTSYRKLAEKYGVSRVQIGTVGKQENWVELRRQYRDKTLSKTVEKISNQQAKQAAKVSALADKLLLKLEKAIDELDDSGTVQVDNKGLRQLTAALQQLQQIKGEISDLDRQEQEARIANLRKNAKEDSKTPGSITVLLEGGLDKYAK